MCALFVGENPVLGPSTVEGELSGYAGNPAGAPALNFYKPTTREPLQLTFASGNTTGWIFRAPWKCQVIQVSMVAEVAATAAATMQLYTVPVASQPEAPSSGNAILSSAQALSSNAFTANTVFVQTLTTSTSLLTMNPGDLLGYNISAAITALVGGLVQVEIIQLG